VQHELVAEPGIDHGDHVRLIVDRVADVGDEAGIDDAVDDVAVVRAARRFAMDRGAWGRFHAI
jgi:hypothetical protein